MLNKSLTLQKDIRNESQNVVAYFNGQISMGFGNINISIQVGDKEYIEANQDMFREEFDSFYEEIKKEAFQMGWKGLLETE